MAATPSTCRRGRFAAGLAADGAARVRLAIDADAPRVAARALQAKKATRSIARCSDPSERRARSDRGRPAHSYDRARSPSDGFRWSWTVLGAVDARPTGDRTPEVFTG